MKRRAVTILSWTPLALSLALCWVSVRGGILGPGDGFTRDVVRPARLDRLHYGFRTARRGFEVASRRWSYPDRAAYESEVPGRGRETRTWGGLELRPQYNVDVHPRLERLGFEFGSDETVAAGEAHAGWAVRVPYWAPAVMLLGLHGAVVARGLRLQRSLGWRRGGRCAACGYDLRASASRCPECGAETQSPERAAG